VVGAAAGTNWSAGTCGRSQQGTNCQQVPLVGVSRYQFSESAGISVLSQQVPVVGVSRYQWWDVEPTGTSGRSQQKQLSESAGTSSGSQQVSVVRVGRYPLSESAGISAELEGTIGRSFHRVVGDIGYLISVE
jgi:hypothetical protein